MKKLLSILLSVSMILSAMVSFAGAEETTAQTGADYFPLWNVVENTNISIERVYDEITESYVAKLSTNGTGGKWNVLNYTVPKSKLVADRAYSVKFYIRSEGLSNPDKGEQWVALDLGGQAYTPWVHSAGYKKTGTTVTFKCNNLYVYNAIKFGLTAAPKEVIYIDNIEIIDDTTGKALDLENLDFESVASDYADNTELPGWTVATDVAGATVERVFHKTYGSWMLKITNNGAGKDIDKVKYTVPKTRLTEGHTYTIQLYSDIDTDITSGAWIHFNGGGVNYGNTFVPNHKNGTTIKVTGADLYSKNTIYFGFDTNFVGEWYLDNLVVTDETTGKIVPLENSDFEKKNSDYYQTPDALNFSGWSAGTGTAYTIERVFNFKTDSWCAKITNNGTSNSWNALKYFIPKDLLVEGRPYTIKVHLLSDALTNASSAEQWVALDFGGATDTPWVHNLKNNGQTITKTGIKLYSNNTVTFGFTHAKAETLYVDNLEIIDEVTGEALDLVNPDFETVLDSSVEFTFDGMMCNANIISTKEEYPIYLVCAVYKPGGTLYETTVYSYDVIKSTEVQNFPMFPSVYSDGYTTKAMLWNAETLEPLAPAIDIE